VLYSKLPGIFEGVSDGLGSFESADWLNIPDPFTLDLIEGSRLLTGSTFHPYPYLFLCPAALRLNRRKPLTSRSRRVSFAHICPKYPGNTVSIGSISD
jgi:hypothetical protein